MSDFPATTSQTARSLGYGFALTVFLSAFLLFQVQPIISKVLLPWFGGSPSVWTTCMLVFQWLLFAGYAYAHLLTTWLGPRLQTWVHGTLLIAAVLLLPILPSAGWKSVAAGQPSLAVATILLACVGLPFFVLSTSGPLLQRWFAGAFVGRSPYRLYALSNAGSLLALLTYPFVVEPSLSIAHQSSVWSGLFAGFAVLCALVGFLSLPGRIGSHRAAAHEIIGGERHPAPTLARVLLWFALGMIPSTMMLAATNQVCADVAPVPFLWLVPLSLYLLSFIICFESSRWYSRGVYTTAFAISAVFMAAALAGGAAIPILVQIVVFFSGSFFCAMFCHGELNRLKPHPQYLTAFYLILAAAGATGGAFVSILAPVLFNSYLEIHVAVLATFLLALGIPLHERRSSLPSLRAGWAWWLLLVVAGGTVVSLGYRAIAEGRGVICAIRNFYGVMRVVDDSSTRNLLHGRINHGRQFLEEAKRQTPTTYFGERSGIGLAMRYHRSGQPRRIGIIGLGAGTLAAYGRSDDTMRFYELDPDVLRLAEEYFTFLGDSAARVETVLGDARLSLEAEWEAEGSQQFDLFVVDAFSGDAIPVHLLTREAMALYLRHLKPDGMLAFHISNRHFDLGPVISAFVTSELLHSRFVLTKGDLQGEVDSTWVLASKAPYAFDNAAYRGLSPLELRKAVYWTDDYCSLAAVLRPQQFDLTLARRSFNASITEGIAALDRNDLESAESAFRRAVADDDRDAGAWLHLGNTLRRKGVVLEAIECYRRAIELNEGYSEAHANLGALVASADPQLAERHIRRAIEIDPRNAEAYNSLANLTVRRGELREAIPLYEQALAIKPSLVSAQQNLALVRATLQQGDTNR